VAGGDVRHPAPGSRVWPRRGAARPGGRTWSTR
jgi:hypothetical protein